MVETDVQPTPKKLPQGAYQFQSIGSVFDDTIPIFIFDHVSGRHHRLFRDAAKPRNRRLSAGRFYTTMGEFTWKFAIFCQRSRRKVRRLR